MSESPSHQPDSDDVAKRNLGSDPPSSGEPDDTQAWRQLFEEVADGLRAFLRSRLRQESDVDDCFQVVLVKMLESAHDVAPAARRAWLFRVAANEAARMWRSEASKNRMLQQHGVDTTGTDDPIDQVILTEATLQIEQSLQRLPPAWREVVRLRIHQNLTFQEIADQLGIPLGTALTRMRRALERLKADINPDEK